MKRLMTSYGRPKSRFWLLSANSAIAVSCALIVPNGELAAQKVNESGATSTDAIVSKHGGSPNSFQDVMTRLVSLRVSDSTLKYVLHALAKQADVKIVYDAENELLNKKTNFNASNKPFIDAVNSAISGSGLQAIVIANGTTVAIRKAKDSTAETNATNKGVISGTVVDSASGKGIAGAVITLRGSRSTATTKDNGAFSFDALPGEYVVDVKALGYASTSRNIKVESGKRVSVQLVLRSSATMLSGVVTTVTGQQKRAEIPTDIVKIDADKVRERSPVRNVVDLIEAAQVPGVLVQRGGGDPGSPSRIRIRGIGSISQSNDPVIILDGVWVDSRTGSSRIDNLDPSSIESVEIVRGPSAATLYGQDASNGVIVITTKKGRVGPTRWNLSYKRDLGQTYGTLPLFYAGVGSSTSTFDSRACPIRDVVEFHCTQDSVLILDPNHPLVSAEGGETRNGYTAQVDGGGQNISYMMTFSTNVTNGIRRIPEVEQIRYRIVGYNLSSDLNRPSELRNNSITSTFTSSPRHNVNLGVTFTANQSNLKDYRLTHNWTNLFPLNSSGIASFSIDTIIKPATKGTATYTESPQRSLTGLVSGNIHYRPNSRSTVSAYIGSEQTSGTTSSYSRPTECLLATGCKDMLGYRSENISNSSLHTIRLNASTTLDLGKINNFIELRPSIGGDYKKNYRYSTMASKSNVPVGDRSMSGGTSTSVTSTNFENALAGWYINSTIGLFRRIYFDLGLRQDIGSAITSSKNTVYPKIGGSWLVSDEGFWRQNNIVNSLRLRSAIGHAAVQPDLADLDGRFVNSMNFIDGVFVNSINMNASGNRALNPERSIELEVGFDAELLDSRLNIVTTFANKNNKNTLVVRRLPESFGGPFSNSRKENIASVRNRNLEFSVIGRAIETDRVLLVLNYSHTLSDNKVLRLGDGVAPFTSGAFSRIAAGYPVAASWGKMTLGYDDLNGDGMLALSEMITEDSVAYKGWSQPRNRSGYGISLTLANQLVFDSRFSFQSRYVHSFQNMQGIGTEDVNAPLPVQAAQLHREMYSSEEISDLRWGSASVTYNLPQSILRRIGNRSMSVSIQGSNLAIWTNYIGRDPGINTFISSGETTIDNGSTPPRPRLFVLDFKIGF